ncbi:hypothetical protein SAMN05216564_103197 [Halopenitus persicus]|uniref:Uncharacterized protein n=1 Tax=Halopenitus persicus TaxID=1048396 RepID=A0A1H3HAR7_9EURY|nr:hypothetical protein SAMN05216564_103197 [Halopenitus persicus]
MTAMTESNPTETEDGPDARISGRKPPITNGRL